MIGFVNKDHAKNFPNAHCTALADKELTVLFGGKLNHLAIFFYFIKRIINLLKELMVIGQIVYCF